jgi:hypothetical protein
VKVGRKDIFKLTVGNESQLEISNDNGVRVVNFATSKNYKYTCTSPEGNTHNQIDHVLIDRR